MSFTFGHRVANVLAAFFGDYPKSTFFKIENEVLVAAFGPGQGRKKIGTAVPLVGLSPIGRFMR